MRHIKITHNITLRDSLALEAYFREIRNTDLLTPEQEVELARRIKQRDNDALEQLTKANLRFVVSVAKQYQKNGLPLSDLINEGNLGLIKAAHRFDETRGFKFISYAVYWIRQAIMQAINEHTRLIRLPGNKIESLQKITRLIDRFEQENQREPSTEEITEVIDLTTEEINDIFKVSGGHLSLDAPLFSDGSSDEFSGQTVIADEDLAQTEKKVFQGSLPRDIRSAISILPKRDRDILVLSFGLGDHPPMTLDQIGKKFDLTRERVRQIKERSLRRLRKSEAHIPQLRSYLG